MTAKNPTKYTKKEIKAINQERRARQYKRVFDNLEVYEYLQRKGYKY